MPYTAQFFAEKLNVEVQYFNPFKNIEIDPAINVEELAATAHAFGEVVGLGLRNVAQCPVEMNLMPKAFLKRQQLNQKKPYFIATVFSLILVVAAFGGFYAKLAAIKNDALQKISAKAQPLQVNDTALKREEAQLARLKQQSAQLHDWTEARFEWPDVLAELRRVLLSVEENRKQAMGGIDNGVWLDSFAAANPGLTGPSAVPTPAESPGPATAPVAIDPNTAKIMRERYGIKSLGGPATVSEDAEPGVGATSARTAKLSTNEVSVINVTCRAVNLQRLDATANGNLAYAVQAAFTNSPMFDPTGTRLSGPINQTGEDDVTFTFGVTLKLMRPIKL